MKRSWIKRGCDGALMARFLSHVSKTETCWLWSCSGPWYGVMRIDGKSVSAHRVSYLLHCGSIPKGAWVLHTCDDKRCVNPAHLYIGTASQNAQDMYARNRHPGWRRTHELHPGMAREWGLKGAAVSLEKTTPEQRSESARKAVLSQSQECRSAARKKAWQTRREGPTQ